MFSHLPPIIAQVNNPKQIEKLRGEGIVEKKIDDTTYILRFSSGKIKVTLTSGSLSERTKVRIKEQGNRIIIIPVHPQKNSTDQITISQNHSENISKNTVRNLLSMVSQVYIETDTDQTIKHVRFIADKIAEEILSNPEFFNSNKELKILGEQIVNKLSKPIVDREKFFEIRDIIRAFETNLIELNSLSEKQQSIVLPRAVESGFSYFTTGKEAIDWLVQTQPPMDKNNIKHFNPSMSDPVIIQTVTGTDGITVLFFMNRDESLNLIESFIHNESKNHLWKALPSDLFLSVLKAKGSITKLTIDSIDKILQSFGNNKNIGEVLSSNGNCTKYLIQQWIALMLDNPEVFEPISKQFPLDASENLGRNFEQLLTKFFSHTPQQSDTIEDVLTNTVKNSDIPKSDSIVHAFARMGYNLEHNLFQSTHMESPLKEEIVNSIKSQLYSLLIEQTQLNDNPADIFKSTLNDNPIFNALEQIRNQVIGISQLFQPNNFTDINLSPQNLQSVLAGIDSPVQNFESNIQNIISNVEEKYMHIMHAFEKGELNRETVIKNLKSISFSLISDINRLFDNIFKEIMSHIEKITKDREQYPQQISRHISQLISQINQTLGKMARNIEQQVDSYIVQSEKNLQPTLPEGMRQQVETMLSRFESLQLLSKPVPTVDGQQQVLTFPVKFGEEWTEVRILLVKKKNKKKNIVNQKNFSVQMHVAPSHCGAVNIHMDYNLKYKLNVNLEFEKTESRLWFNKYREQLITALKNNGIPSVTLSLVSGLQSTHRKKKNQVPIAPDKNRKNTKIDINV